MLRLLALLAAGVALHAATLSRLSMDEMIDQSSDIVRARVVAERSAFRGAAGARGMIYTWYALQVIERWKGGKGTQLEVAVPGGASQGYRQTIAGAPSLHTGDEYVFFVWTSRSGLPQIIGLSQGLFNVKPDASGKLSATRAPASETVLDPGTGKPVQDRGVKYTYDELKALVSTRLSGGRTQ